MYVCMRAWVRGCVCVYVRTYLCVLKDSWMHAYLVFLLILEYQVLKKAHLARHLYVSKKIITSGKPQVYALVMCFDLLLDINVF